MTLKLMGGDADIDLFLQETRSNKLDLKGTILNDRTVAMKEYWNYLFYYGTAYDASAYSGLHQLMTSTTYNTINNGNGSATHVLLNISTLRTALDMITGFTPQVIMMSKKLRRYLNTYFDSIGDKMPSVINTFGMTVPSFDGIPIETSDFISDTETIASDVFSARTGSDGTSIFILNFEPEAICGVQGSSGLKVENLGQLETKNAERYRIKWACGLKLMNLRSCAKITGIDVDGTIAA